MNISGDFNTAEKEIKCVCDIFTQQGIVFENVEKNPNDDEGDILVTLKDGKVINIEIKEESYERFNKFGDLGVDFISVFYFKKEALNWKGAPKNPRLLDKFLNDIDKTKHFKYGKLYYSKADLWLFFVNGPSGFCYYEFFDGPAMTSKEMKEYLFDNCYFAVNNKPYWQISYNDRYNSAVFFINHKNEFLNRCRVDLKKFLNN